MPSTQTDAIGGISTSVAVKAGCRIYSTGNLVLSGLQNVAGYAVQEGDRVFARLQTDTTEGGIYNATSGAWTRAPDFDGARDVAFGTIILAANSAGAISFFQVTTLDPAIGSAMTFNTLDIGDAAASATQAIASAAAALASQIAAAASQTAAATSETNAGTSATGAAASATTAAGQATSATASATLAAAYGGVQVRYATLSQLNADLAWAANSLGGVYNDPTQANNGTYIKSGGSGSGSWALTQAAALTSEIATRAAFDTALGVDTSRSTDTPMNLGDPSNIPFLQVKDNEIQLHRAGTGSRIAMWTENEKLAEIQYHAQPFPLLPYSVLMGMMQGQSEGRGNRLPALGYAGRTDCSSLGALPNPSNGTNSQYAGVTNDNIFQLTCGNVASQPEHPLAMATWGLASYLNDGIRGINKKFYVGTPAVGNTAIEERLKSAGNTDGGGNLYNKMTQFITKTYAKGIVQGPTAQLFIINWDGPSNYALKVSPVSGVAASNDYHTVLSLYDQYWKDHMTDIKALTTQVWDPAWFQVMCGPCWGYTGNPAVSVNNAQLDWTLAKRRLRYSVWALSTNSFMPKSVSGGPHPQAPSAMWSGALMARQMADVFNGQDRFPPYIEWTKIRGKVIYCGIKSPLPLRSADYYFISDAHNDANKGFYVTDTNGPIPGKYAPVVKSTELVSSHIVAITCERAPDPTTYRVMAGLYRTADSYYGDTNIYDRDLRTGLQLYPSLASMYLDTTTDIHFPESNIAALVGSYPRLSSALCPYTTGGASGGDWNMYDQITALITDLTWQA